VLNANANAGGGLDRLLAEPWLRLAVPFDVMVVIRSW
jgi:hypothetical protein